jgi:phospholipid/cholesterol/gamma-HCH transport system permease protein
MDAPAAFSLHDTAEGPLAVLTGDWTASNLGETGADLRRALSDVEGVDFDLTGVSRMDTAGAHTVIKAAGGRLALADEIKARPETRKLLKLVDDTLKIQRKRRFEPRGFSELLIRIGRGVVNLGLEFIDTLAFAGHLLLVLIQSLVDPRRIRWAALVSQAERAGLDAIPIVATTAFFIGAVVGLLGANMLQQFGAQVFAVELIGIAVLREFNIIITAVLLAGRSASSFAAEIGSMKMNQEVDAMRVMGVEPFEALVLPRFLALLLTIPLLTFVATIAGLIGGGVVTWTVLDLGPAFFMQRIADNVGAVHFWVGMSKAPVMAAVIAGIGCRQGMEVGGDVESLGRRVTAAVVHAIFAIILIDAIFALIYMEADV